MDTRNPCGRHPRPSDASEGDESHEFGSILRDHEPRVGVFLEVAQRQEQKVRLEERVGFQRTFGETTPGALVVTGEISESHNASLHGATMLRGTSRAMLEAHDPSNPKSAEGRQLALNSTATAEEVEAGDCEAVGDTAPETVGS